MILGIAALVLLGADCLIVSGDRVRAEDLTHAIRWAEALPQKTDLFPAPGPGVRRWLSPSDIDRLATRFGVPSAAQEQGLCITRESRVLSAQAVRESIRSSLPEEVAVELQEFSRYPVPTGSLEFPDCSRGRANRAGPVLCRGFVRSSDSHSTPIWARVQMTVEQNLLVASRDLSAGSILRDSDYQTDRRRVPYRGSPGVSPVPEIHGRVLRKSLRGGDEIRTEWTAPAPDVSAGQQVQVNVVQGGVHLRITAQAENGGKAGTRIWLRASKDGRRFPARVVGPGSVEVESQPGNEEHASKIQSLRQRPDDRSLRRSVVGTQ